MMIDNTYNWRYVCAIENTAARLGVDPVALAEAAQDGEALSEGLAALCRESPKWMDWLASLKARKAAD